MIDISASVSEFNYNALKNAVDKAAFTNFNHAAARIRLDAMASIKVSASPSSPGTPPNTRGRNVLKGAIVYSADKTGAVIGPRYSRVGGSASVHEFGGTYKSDSYPRRPFMGPALDRNLARFADDWEHSIGST